MYIRSECMYIRSECMCMRLQRSEWVTEPSKTCPSISAVPIGGASSSGLEGETGGGL